jgi:3-hydroxyacyl-CoA dehydrogenase
VVVWARSDGSAGRADQRIRALCEKAGASVNGTLRITCDPADLAESSFVVEAIVESPSAKCELIARLGADLPADTLLATTTSSLSVETLAGASGRPDRFVGLHVFNPVPKMELVELAFPSAAGEATRDRARALCTALGKTAVEVPDTPGFVVNRLLFPYLFEAVRLMERTGLEPEAIDTCMRLGAGHPLGPLALLDLVGLDTALSILGALQEEFGDPNYTPVPLLKRMVAAGYLGRKSGRGFFDYSR